jgi:hypothetical protein
MRIVSLQKRYKLMGGVLPWSFIDRMSPKTYLGYRGEN